MEPILSKQEIADLLSAIKEGKVSTELDGAEAEEFRHLSCEEVDIFNVASRRDDIRIPNFDIILDSFAQNYSVSLSNQLQRTFSIVRTSMESMPFQEYLLSKNNPGSIGVLNFSSLKQGALLIYDPPLSFCAVEVMLGAAADLDMLQPERELTKIELTVLKSTMNKACTDLDRAFRPINELGTSLLKIENNPRLVSITEPETEVIIGSFQVAAGEHTGVLELVFPQPNFDPYRDKFRDLLNVNRHKQGDWSAHIREEVREMSATVIAQSGVLDLSVGQVMNFKVGEVIPLDYDLDSPLRVLVEEKLKFFAVPGTHQGKKAISLTGISQ